MYNFWFQCAAVARKLHRHDRTKALMAIVVLVTVAALAWAGTERGDGTSVAEEIRARRLVIVDEDGNKRAAFGIMSDGELRLELRDKQNRVKTLLGLEAIAAPSIAIIGERENPLIELASAEGRAPIFIMRDSAGKRRVAATVTPDGAVSFILADSREKTRSMMTVNKEGEPMVMLRDSEGKTRGNIMVQKDGTCAIDLLDGDGHTRMTLALDDHGKPAIIGFDSTEQPIWSVPGADVGRAKGGKRGGKKEGGKGDTLNPDAPGA